MNDAILALFRSRKFLVYLVVSILGAALVASGKLSIDRFEAFVSGLAGILIAAIAYEDGQAKSVGGTSAGAQLAPVPIPPPVPPRRPPADSSTRLAFAGAFALGGFVVLLVSFVVGCAPAANDVTDAAAKAYQTEQDACFDAAERESATCPAPPAAERATCLDGVRSRLHACRTAVKTRWGRS